MGLRAPARRIAFCAAVMCSLLFAVGAAAQVVDPSSMTNKIICGYQGWHCCPGDGNNSGVAWYHWANDSSWIGPGNYHTEIWPDTAEYNSSDLFVVPNTTLTQGGTPRLYSASRPGAVNTHFRWMQEYGIDGVFLQRFVCDLADWRFFDMRGRVTANVKSAASTYGRIWALEYDISGTSESALYNKITSDWDSFKGAYNIVNDPRYLHHNGKPVVAVWGFGFTDRPGTPQMCIDVINFFKNNGCFVVGGVPWGWRDRTGGSKTDPAWDTAYRSFDCITPWTVGLYTSWSGINSYKSGRATSDRNTCTSLGILYMQTSWPRFGWDNMNNYPCGQSDISSRGGQHLWDQFYAYKSLGVSVQFLAMFDEYDESTAIMKLTDNVPTTGCWWTTEGKGNDWWLRLAGQGAKMQRGEIATSQTIPIISSTSPDSAQITGNTIPAQMDQQQQYSVSVTVKNTGETCWHAVAFKLGGVDDSDPFASTRQTMPGGTTVMPNQTYTFNFTMTAPATAGTYTTDWRMVHELVRWFGDTLTKQVQVTEVDTVPPAAVSSFVASPGNGESYLSWTNPSVGDFARTMVRYSTTAYPTSQSDGTLVCDRAASPGSSDSYTHSGLTNGIRCYYSAFAYDEVPNYSTAPHASALPVYSGPVQAKLSVDGTFVTVTVGVVCAASTDWFYIECPDDGCGACGLKVTKSGHGFVSGQSALVRGTMRTDSATGERYLSAVWLKGIGAGSVPVRAMTNTMLGGPDWNYNSSNGAGQGGVIGGTGVNNIGLLVRVWGKVAQTDTSGLAYFYIDDGSGIKDSTKTAGVGNVGVRVSANPTGYATGDYVIVTGVSSCFKDGSGNLRRQVIPISGGVRKL